MSIGQFIQWSKDMANISKLKTQKEKLKFLKAEKNVDYIVTKRNLNEYASLIHKVNELRLYQLHD